MKREHFPGRKNKAVSSKVTWYISEHAQKTWHDKNSGSMARNDRREDQGHSVVLLFTEFYAKTKSFRLTPIRTRTHSSQSGVNNPTQL